MARMVPFPMLPTDSAAERRLYEGFLEQLDDSYVVYHSVDWVLAGPNGPDEGEADFVVAHPVAGILVLETKGGSLDYDPATRRWTQAGHSGRHRLDEDPFHQAEGEMRSLVRILQAQEGWERWRPTMGFGLAMPDARYDVAAHPDAPSEIVIDRDDLRHLGARVGEILAHWPHSDRRFGAEGMEALAFALGYRVEVRSPLRIRFDEEDRKIVELTQDQAWVLSFVTNRRRAAVTGPAGSGKTMLALELAKRLAAKEHRTLLTCSSRRLADHLAEVSGGVNGLDVEDFQALCTNVAAEAGVDLPAASAEPDSPYLERSLPDALAEAASRLGPRYDAIVVDEAHEFRPRWWPALLGLHRDPEGGLLYLFADASRSLDPDALPIPPEEHLGPIGHNLRNTEEISEFVSVFYDGDGAPVGGGRAGRPVEVLGYDDEAGLVALVTRVLMNLVALERVPLADIALLTPSDPGSSRLLTLTEIAGYRLSPTVEPDTLLATTVRDLQGLERPVVILAELEEGRDEELRRYLYVGASRARDHLIVVATERVARELRRLAGITGS